MQDNEGNLSFLKWLFPKRSADSIICFAVFGDNDVFLDVVMVVVVVVEIVSDVGPEKRNPRQQEVLS